LVTFDSSVLLGYYQSKYSGQASTAGTTSATGGKPKYAPTAPWDTKSTAMRADALVKQVMGGRSFINENAAQLDLPSASADYKKLFALYQGLNTLYGLTESASSKTASPLDLTRYTKLFNTGMSQVGAYADSLNLDQIRLTRGSTMLTDKATIGVPKAVYSYKTDTLATGTVNDVIPAFEGDAAFSLDVKRQGVTKTINFDLSDMGSTPRSMANVVNYMNNKLAAEGGITTRFAIDRTTAQPRTVTVGGKPVTLPAVGDALALKINSDSAEQLKFQAVSKPAVYVTTYSGDPDPDKKTTTDDGVFESKLLKLDPSAATAPETRIKTEALEGTVGAVRQTQVGPDGSVYMIADVKKSVDGQAIKGDTDVALLKYDNAGKLLYARTLGAADNASGLALTVASDGRVAVAGSVTGDLDGATNGPLNSTTTSGKTDSFVTVYDAKGDETWTMRRGAQQEDEATAVAFGSDGVVYVAGRTKSSLPNGGGQIGGWDSYLSAYAPGSTGIPKALFTQQFGTTGNDAPTGLVVDGDRVLVAGSEDGHAVVRSFDTSTTTTTTTKTETAGVLTVTVASYKDGVLQNSNATNYAGTGKDSTSSTTYTSAGAATQGASRDLGDLQGGSIAGLVMKDGKLWVAGNTRNAALGIDDVANAHAGNMDAFAGSISLDLSSHADDHLTYYGGAGDNTVSGFAVSGGKVYVTGSAGADLPGLDANGHKEGYVAALDVDTGAVTGAQRISGKDGYSTATSIAVDDSGASALDKFGLPSGVMDFTQSTKIVSATSARAGDQFQIRTREGGLASTVTLAANDTLETLASKIRAAAGYHAKVTIVSDGDQRVLKIEPANDSSTVEILPGKGGKNVLDALGLTEGIARKTKINADGKSVPTAGGGNIYGIGLDMDLNISSKASIKTAQDVLMQALTKIRTAYKDLAAAAAPKSTTTAAKSAAGPVPAYLSAQIANYQAGLDRLTGGG
jgi:hypothetical protein